MMDGLPVDLTEEDVGHHPSHLLPPINLHRISRNPKCSVLCFRAQAKA